MKAIKAQNFLLSQAQNFVLTKYPSFVFCFLWSKITHSPHIKIQFHHAEEVSYELQDIGKSWHPHSKPDLVFGKGR